MPGIDVVRYRAASWLTEDASNKIIARKLVITESTVKVHIEGHSAEAQAAGSDPGYDLGAHASR